MELHTGLGGIGLVIRGISDTGISIRTTLESVLGYDKRKKTNSAL